MKIFTACVVSLLGAASASADCPLDRISQALAAPLDAMQPLELRATSIQSSGGGEWQVFREKNGRVHTIIRRDYGEGGRTEQRLTIIGRGTYGIARTDTAYIRHILGEGPFAVAEQSTRYYYYCDGKAHMPDENWGMVDRDAYPRAAKEAQSALLDDKDVAGFTADLAK